MTKPFESFEERILSIGAETLDAIDAQLEAERNDPNHQSRKVGWLDDPDPFGMNWAWAEPSEQEARTAPRTTPATAESLAVIPLPSRPERWSPLRRVAYAAGAAIAASLLIAVGALIASRGGGEKEILLAQAEVRFGDVRGGEEQIPRVEVESSSRGFLTVLALLPGDPSRPVVIPSPFEKDIPVAPGRKADSGPFPPQARSAKAALIIVTKTPAAGTIEKYLDETSARFSANQAEQFEATIRRALSELNFEAAAISRVAIEPPK